MTKSKKLKSPLIDNHKKLKSDDYVLVEGSGWFEYQELVVHIFVPYGNRKLVAEIFPVDCAMDDDDILAECSAELP